MIELRPYQDEALARAMGVLTKRDNCLLQAPTGAGKTIIFAHLISQWVKKYPKMRIAVLAHRQELINQAYEKLIAVDQSVWSKTGKACAGLGRVTTTSQVIVGSLQTLVKRELYQPIHLLIVDEAHRMPPKDRDSQYKELITRLKAKFPRMRMMGVTATPFRLGHGYIFGQEDDWFEALDYEINMKTLIDDGYLVPIRFKINELEGLAQELVNVKKSGGEYVLDGLSSVMTKKIFIDSAVTAWRTYGEERKSGVVFATTIHHGELLVEAFRAAGLKAKIVHSKMNNSERHKVLAEFERNYIDFIVNVGILTEGWDSPKVNLIIMARPTLSPGLYVQMIGRGTRLYDGKKDLLALDLVNNSQVHGLPWAPIIKNKSSSSGSSWVQLRKCPNCKELILDLKAKECPVCGYELEEDKPPVELEDPGVIKMRELSEGYEVKVTVEKFWGAPYVSQKGNEMLKLTVHTAEVGTIYDYLDFEGNSGLWSQSKAKRWWRKFATTEPPGDASEASDRLDELEIPDILKVKRENKWLRINW
jgi:DNA repair protein RadD